MAKFLRILPESLLTPSNGSALINPDIVLHASAVSNGIIHIQINNMDAGSDLLSITFSGSDSTRNAHRIFLNALCAASSNQNSGTYYDLPTLISGATGAALTVNSITYS
jgi:hypothetical protein